MKFPHTPAPWRNGWGKVIDAEGKAICMVTYRKNGNNGDLLAAAPDLLELARQIVLAAEQNEGSIPADIVSGAVAAIARATGENA